MALLPINETLEGTGGHEEWKHWEEASVPIKQMCLSGLILWKSY